MRGNPSLSKVMRGASQILEVSVSVGRQRSEQWKRLPRLAMCVIYFELNTAPFDVSDTPAGCNFGVDEIGLGGC